MEQRSRIQVGVIAGAAELHHVTVLGSESTRSLLGDGAVALAERLAALGLQVRLGFNELSRAGRNYLFGVHGLDPGLSAAAIRAGSVVVNTEPIATPAQVLGELQWQRYLPLLQQAHVFDYSSRNIDAFQRLAVPALSYSQVAVGFAQRNVCAVPKREQDIDVLFYGRLNERRRRVVNACLALGLNTVALEGGFAGPARSEYLARSKVVLNVGFVDNSVFEQYRVSFALNNGKAVVSECHPDERLPATYRDALCIAEYDDLARACQRLVSDRQRRLALEAQALTVLKAPEFDAQLRAAVQRIGGV